MYFLVGSTDGAQDLHKNLLWIGDAAFLGKSKWTELNWEQLPQNDIQSSLMPCESGNSIQQSHLDSTHLHGGITNSQIYSPRDMVPSNEVLCPTKEWDFDSDGLVPQYFELYHLWLYHHQPRPIDRWLSLAKTDWRSVDHE